ncbi:MAG: hypothetical protein ACM3Q2_03350 [Syntrophothermus sp.]
MKRLFYAIAALFIISGYALAQNEAYLDQVGASGTIPLTTYHGVNIHQLGVDNKLGGPGDVPTDPAIGAVRLRGATNALVVNQIGTAAYSNEGWIHQNGGTTAINIGVLSQIEGRNDAHIKQKGAISNTFSVYQTDLSAPHDGKNKAKLVQEGPTNFATSGQFLDGGGSNYYNVDQLSGTANLVTSLVFLPYFPSYAVSNYGILQAGGANRLSKVAVNPSNAMAVDGDHTAPTFQTATGINFMAIYQESYSTALENRIAMSQTAAAGDNVAALIQEGVDLEAYIVQDGSANTVVGMQTGADKYFSVHQEMLGGSPTANACIFTQL